MRRGTNEAWEGAGAEQGCAPKSGRGPGEAEGTAVERRISRGLAHQLSLWVENEEVSGM